MSVLSHTGATGTDVENAGLRDPADPERIAALDRQFVMGTYARYPVVFVRGEGKKLWDSQGREYLDFLSGIAVVGVGHCHPHVADAIARQARTLVHVSNLFHNPLQAVLAERLCRLTGMEKVFFCNSGAEANECAIKLARKWGRSRRGASCHEIITFTGSFHGRTFGAVSATAQPKYQAAFAPMVPGFHYVPLNDLRALDERITENTCAVLIEPIQGESGIHPATPEFLSAVRALCDEAEVLLICDEVQCGMGRTGAFLASQACGVVPDVVTLAKGIADGFPMGACLARGNAADTLAPGDHGSTFAGQPLACAAALATLDVLEREELMQNAVTVGTYFRERLHDVQREMPDRVREVRGLGLMVGMELAVPIARTVVLQLLERGVVVNAVGDTVLRFLPPLIVSRDDCDTVVDRLRDALRASVSEP
ncbi:MAG: acetylornithine transaminase [Chloroherpetonaceae bacterium]|nr:acetylornithine transaminase [Chthonomonadaceae bacterium]MDW8208960.1 acetylornithine transaminase [Chloroherpetonaceae bacterium]